MVVKVAETSTGVSPVTQTALVETNSESINEIPLTVDFGSIKSPVPMHIIKKKLTANISDGLVRRPKRRINPLDKLRKEKSKSNTTWNPLLCKKNQIA